MKLGLSNFILSKEIPYTGNLKSILDLVRTNWNDRVPGQGRNDFNKVVVVPIPEVENFTSSWIHIDDVTEFVSRTTKRQEHEDSYVETFGNGDKPLPCKFVKIVLYSRDTLLENDGEVSGDFDWEVVAILTGPWEDCPMHPLTMARNALEKPGGTYAKYTEVQFAEAIYFWSKYVKLYKSK